jgi:N-terminal acetyltransferase B complex non-catalytic subunit
VQAWKADNYLQVDKLADCGQTLIELLARKPPITDFTLLGYIYQICIGSLRRREPELAICPTAGYGVQNTWQDAAKSLPSRKARLDLWSSFFVTAMREGCWDDVRIVRPKFPSICRSVLTDP